MDKIPPELVIIILNYTNDASTIAILGCNKYLYSLRSLVKLKVPYTYPFYLKSKSTGYNIDCLHLYESQKYTLHSHISKLYCHDDRVIIDNLQYLSKLNSLTFKGNRLNFEILPRSIKRLVLSGYFEITEIDLSVLVNLTMFSATCSLLILTKLPPSLVHLCIGNYNQVRQLENNITALTVAVTTKIYPPKMTSLMVLEKNARLDNLPETLLSLSVPNNVSAARLPQGIKYLKVFSITDLNGSLPNLKKLEVHNSPAETEYFPAGIGCISVYVGVININTLPDSVKHIKAHTNTIIKKFPLSLEWLDITYENCQVFDTKLFADLKYLNYACIKFTRPHTHIEDWPSEFEVQNSIVHQHDVFTLKRIPTWL